MDNLYLIVCPSCGRRMQVTESHFGRTGRCTECRQPISISHETVSSLTESRQDTAAREAPRAEVPEDHLWKVGDRVLDMYDVRGILGEGGMGTVYQVRHVPWRIDLAVKVPKPALLKRTRGAQNVERECETWINLGLHPHIVSCYYVRRIQEVPCIFAEFVAGGSLWHWIKDRRVYAGSPAESLERVLRAGLQTAWGLHYAHQKGVIHRDVKPTNVLMTPEGTAKVTDFGLARALRIEEGADPANAKVLTSGRGLTPAYCSPEQEKAGELSLKTDMWSWALLMLELFIGKLAWKKGPEGPGILERLVRDDVKRAEGVPDLPPGLADLLGRCLNPEPAARPADMKAVGTRMVRLFEEHVGVRYPSPEPMAIEAEAGGLNNRAVSLLDLDKRNEAIELWNQALEAESQHPESTHNLSLVQWRMGAVADTVAVRRMSDVAVSHPNQWRPVVFLAETHLERGDVTAAEGLLTELLRREPHLAEAQRLLERVRGAADRERRRIRTITGHQDRIRALRFVPRKHWAVSSSDDNAMFLWNLESSQKILTYSGHVGAVGAVDVTADGARLMSVGADRTIRLWDVASGEMELGFEGDREAVYAAALSRDGAHVATRGSNSTILLYATDSGRSIRVFEGHRDAVNDLAFSAGGRYVVSAGEDHTVRLWETDSAHCVRTFQAHEGPVRCVAISHDSGYALSGGTDGRVILWEVATGAVHFVLEGHTGAVHDVCFSQDGRWALSGGADGTVRLWSLAEGRCLRTYEGLKGGALAVDLRSDGRYGLSGDESGEMQLWRLQPDAKGLRASLALCRAQASETILSHEVAFNKQLDLGRRALAGRNGSNALQHLGRARQLPGCSRRPEVMELWAHLYRLLVRQRLAGGWEGPQLKGHKQAVHDVVFLPDGKRLLSAGQDATVRLWDCGSGQCVRVFQGHRAAVKAVACSSDGRLAASGSEDTSVRLWDTATGNCLRVLEGSTGSAETVAISPDNRFVLAGGWDVRIWDIGSGHLVRLLEGHSADVVSVSWSPDATLVLTGSSDETIVLWDVLGAEPLLRLEGGSGAVKDIAVNPGCSHVIAATGNMWGNPGDIDVWDAVTGDYVETLEGHNGTVNAVTLSTDARFAVSGGGDGEAILWNLAATEPVRRFQATNQPVLAVDLSLDGYRMAAASADGMIHLWVLDWAVGPPADANWQAGTLAYIEDFLTRMTPPKATLEEALMPAAEDIDNALQRKGVPAWRPEDMQVLLHTLACAGFGWVPASHIEAYVQQLAAKRGRFTLFGRGKRRTKK